MRKLIWALLLAVPATGFAQPQTGQAWLERAAVAMGFQRVETLKVSSTTYLLANPGYREAVTLAGDEVFVFDATQGDERAAADAAIIARLFPGRHKINVVVTDLAWPHIAGVRYWVSQGATIVAHRAARPFLEEIVNRRWTLRPDTLEQRRDKVKFSFVGVDAPVQFADGKISLAPIDGIGSEPPWSVSSPLITFSGLPITSRPSPSLRNTPKKSVMQCNVPAGSHVRPRLNTWPFFPGM
jgi:hypothetical protein